MKVRAVKQSWTRIFVVRYGWRSFVCSLCSDGNINKSSINRNKTFIYLFFFFILISGIYFSKTTLFCFILLEFCFDFQNVMFFLLHVLLFKLSLWSLLWFYVECGLYFRATVENRGFVTQILLLTIHTQVRKLQKLSPQGHLH